MWQILCEIQWSRCYWHCFTNKNIKVQKVEQLVQGPTVTKHGNKVPALIIFFFLKPQSLFSSPDTDPIQLYVRVSTFHMLSPNVCSFPPITWTFPKAFTDFSSFYAPLPTQLMYVFLKVLHWFHLFSLPTDLIFLTCVLDAHIHLSSDFFIEHQAHMPRWLMP